MSSKSQDEDQEKKKEKKFPSLTAASLVVDRDQPTNHFCSCMYACMHICCREFLFRGFGPTNGAGGRRCGCAEIDQDTLLTT